MKHSPRVLLRHAELEAYFDDRPAQLAVERCFATIGEALNRLHRSSTKITGMRN